MGPAGVCGLLPHAGQASLSVPHGRQWLWQKSDDCVTSASRMLIYSEEREVSAKERRAAPCGRQCLAGPHVAWRSLLPRRARSPPHQPASPPAQEFCTFCLLPLLFNAPDTHHMLTTLYMARLEEALISWRASQHLFIAMRHP